MSVLSVQGIPVPPLVRFAAALNALWHLSVRVVSQAVGMAMVRV
jgi:hypothetical protein